MRLQRSHSLGKEEAVIRLQALTNYWSNQYGIRSEWSGDQAKITGKVKGIKFDGTIQVGESNVDADLNVGFLAEKMGGRQYVEEKLRDYLNPANSVDDLKSRN